MVFAKALFAMFILSLVNLGESQRLKKFENSTVKSNINNAIPLHLISDQTSKGNKFCIFLYNIKYSIYIIVPSALSSKGMFL